MSETSEQGWYNQIDQSFESSPEKMKLREFKLEPNDLISQSYPIEPDMILGWKPKLPTGPVPLSYPNQRSDYVLAKLQNLSSYKLVYLGNRYINNVKINQQYQYTWKQRNKYRLNLKLLQQAIQSVGSINKVMPSVHSCQYTFNSNFQSGNLDFVIETNPHTFDCFARSDTNTKGHCNWFYFSVKNKYKPGTIKLNMCNLTKNANLYRKGMKPFMRSDESSWRQLKTDISYIEKYCRYGYHSKNYQLQFEVKFDHPNQTIEIAYGIPYTYSMLQKFIQNIKKQYPNYVTTQNLCYSLGGLPLPLLTITDQNSWDKKQIVLLTSRIHPGQSVSSFVLQGFVKTLLSSYHNLLQKFVFKVIPMLNPDGVVVGNFRTSYSGKDLNRQFKKINKYIFPQNFYLDKLAKSLRKEYDGKLVYYFDFHGHSTKTNLFCYGPEYSDTNSYYLKSRAFAKILEQQDNLFDYKKSIFTISSGKKTTGRAFMLRKIKIPMTFTFELSNGLYQNLQGLIVHLEQTQMNKAGIIILQGFNKYSSLITQTKLKSKTHQRIRTKLHPPILSISNQKTSYSSQKLMKKRTSCLVKASKTKFNIKHSQLDSIFQSILKQQQQQIIQQQGGSDSQDQNQDFNSHQTATLFKTICQRQIKQPKLSPKQSCKLKNLRNTNYLLLKSQKSQKQPYFIKNQQRSTLTNSKPIIIIPKPHIRSLTARIRRSTIPNSITTAQHQIQPLVQKQVLLQRHFVINL